MAYTSTAAIRCARVGPTREVTCKNQRFCRSMASMQNTKSPEQSGPAFVPGALFLRIIRPLTHMNAGATTTTTLRFRPAKGVFVALVAACSLIGMLAIGLALLAPRLQEHYSFLPTKSRPTPKSAGGDGKSLLASKLPTKKDLWIRTADGETLNAWLVPPQKEGALLLQESAESRRRLRRSSSRHKRPIVPEEDSHPDDDPHNFAKGEYPTSWNELRMVRAKKPNGLVLVYFHGNAGELTNYEMFILNWSREGYTVLMPDYRGFGLSTGRPSFRGVKLDAEATMEVAAGLVDGDMSRIVVVGFSMGSAAAMHAAMLYDDVGLGACVIEAGFLDIRSAALHLVPGIAPLASVLSPSLDNGTAARNVRSTPLAVVHAQEDRTTAFADAVALYKSAATPVKHWFISEAAAHVAIHSGSRVKEWVQRHRRRSVARPPLQLPQAAAGGGAAAVEEEASSVDAFAPVEGSARGGLDTPQLDQEKDS